MNSQIRGIREFLLSDKRKGERLRLPIKISFSLLGDGKRWMKPVSIEDVSGNGLKFTNDKKIEVGTELNLKIVLPEKNSEPIIVKGAVIWCAKSNRNAYHIGVNFHKMNYLDRKRYVEYICEKILLKYLKNEATALSV